MSDKQFVLKLPEALIDQAQAAHIDVRQVVIDALENEVNRLRFSPQSTVDQVEAAVQLSLQRVASGFTKQRILGLHQGNFWMSDDFDEPLSDEFWLGSDL